MAVLRDNSGGSTPAVACQQGGEQAADLVEGWELNPELQELADLGDAPAVAEILRMFLDDTEQQIEAAERAMQMEDCASVRNVAHTLSGSSATIGWNGFSVVARQMQMLAQSQRLAESRERLEDLRRQIPAAKRAIGQLITEFEQTPEDR
jgi:HPt (histidine-containing phosphotransfer) domain-containing protein